MPERHPIPERPAGKTDEQRIWHLEQQLAMLWDQVWWMQLPFWRRWWYVLQGFRSPITNFYEEI